MLPIAKRLLTVITVSCLLMMGACKKDPKEDSAPDDDGVLHEIPADMKLLITPKPATTGAKVTKVIGPAGGR